MKSKCFLLSAGMVVLVLLLTSCPNPISTHAGGALTVSIKNAVTARTLLPAIDMNAASYTISGTGPNGAAFSQSTSGGSLTVESLAFGGWNVTVDALNAGETRIG